MNLAVNPVLGREIKERFRSRRAPVFVTLWVLGVGLIGYLVYLVAQLAARSAFGLGQGVAGGYMGRFIFEGMMALLMTGVIMIVPGLTALSIVANARGRRSIFCRSPSFPPSRSCSESCGRPCPISCC